MLQAVRPMDDSGGGGAPARPATAAPRRRVLVVLGHPRRASLCGALADAYAAGARAAGAEVRLIAVGEMGFDPDVTRASPRHQPAEPDVAEARGLIAWADHLTFVFPTWWGTMPAALKGFLDR